MKIIIQPHIMARLLCYAVATENEFSGFGFCTRNGEGNIEMYDFSLQNVGSYTYTQTDPKMMLPLLERPDKKNMKIWLHRHPVGNGIPGPHNWSGRDEMTIKQEPLGTTPQDAGWSISIVITPKGFVGRIDNYLKNITQHLEVEPATLPFFNELESIERQCLDLKNIPHAVRSLSELEEESEHFPALETSRKKKKSKTGANTMTWRMTARKKASNTKKKTPR